MALQADIKALFEAGAHFGHKTSRWHPKMAPYIHSKRQASPLRRHQEAGEGHHPPSGRGSWPAICDQPLGRWDAY